MLMDTFFENLSSAVLDFADTFHMDVVVRVLIESRYVEEPERFYYTIAHKTTARYLRSITLSGIFIRITIHGSACIFFSALLWRIS